MEDFDPTEWLRQGREYCEQARTGKVRDGYSGDIEIPYDVSAWPQAWIAADLLTHDINSAREAELGMVLDAEHALTVTPRGDVDALLAAGDLEGAWRACFDPALADAIEARDTAPITKLKEPKKKSDLEKVWAEAARTLSPRSAFAGTWPSKWKDAQRRMRVLYARPRSPLFAAAAVAFAGRDDLGYSSIAAQTYWQAVCWFIAEQGDVRQLPALEALEKRVCEIEGRKELVATPALRAFVPRELSAKTRAAIAALAVEKPAAKPALSITSAEERSVAADQLLLEGDPRGEFIVVQQRIIDDGPTKELLKQQKALLKKHIKAWCPAMIARDTCVFRGGVPVDGQLQFHSDVELRSFAGAKALATFETLRIPPAAMGPIKAQTIADVVRSLPNLRHVITSDQAAFHLARGEPTAIEHVTIEGPRGLPAARPGLPKLRRVDATWIADTPIVGYADGATWWDERPKDRISVFTDQWFPGSSDRPWELWAEGDVMTARPLAGSTKKSLDRTCSMLVLWTGIRVFRIPENFCEAPTGDAIRIEPIAAVEPARLGYALCMK